MRRRVTARTQLTARPPVPQCAVYTQSKAEILALALAKTAAGAIPGGAADWIEPRKFDCPNCGEIDAVSVRQAVRDETCLYVCRQCDVTVNERLPF